MIILANDGLSRLGIEKLKNAGHTVLEHRVAQEQLPKFLNENFVEVLLVRSATKVSKALIEACPHLKIVGRGGIGMDNIDVEYAQSKGIKVINTPTASSRSVAEMVFAHFFSLARFLHESNRTMPLEGECKFAQLKKAYSGGVELKGKHLGIIGFGGIGKEIAQMGLALGMRVSVLTRNQRKEIVDIVFFDGQKVTFDIETQTDYRSFLRDIDFLTINTPKTEEYIIDTPHFEMMKEGVFIVNTARGGVLNEVSLIDFLESGKIAGAALDVFENEPHPELPLLMHPQISLSPHLGGSTRDAQEKIGLELAEQIIKLSNI